MCRLWLHARPLAAVPIGNVTTLTGAGALGKAGAASAANGFNTSVGSGVAVDTPAGSLSAGIGESIGQSVGQSGALAGPNGAALSAPARPISVSVSGEASPTAQGSPTCCPNVDDGSMVANLRHHAADRVGVRCLIRWRYEGKREPRSAVVLSQQLGRISVKCCKRSAANESSRNPIEALGSVI